MTKEIFMFLFGAVTGITLLITWACCVIGDRESRREEDRYLEGWESGVRYGKRFHEEITEGEQDEADRR